MTSRSEEYVVKRVEVVGVLEVSLFGEMRLVNAIVLKVNFNTVRFFFSREILSLIPDDYIIRSIDLWDFCSISESFLRC